MSKSQIITGSILVIIGLLISLVPLYKKGIEGLIALIYGVPIFIIGILILLNKAEDKIEEIKKENKKDKKWKI